MYLHQALSILFKIHHGDFLIKKKSYWEYFYNAIPLLDLFILHIYIYGSY